MQGEMHHVIFWLGGTALVLGGLYYFFVHRHMTEARKPKSESGITTSLPVCIRPAI